MSTCFKIGGSLLTNAKAFERCVEIAQNYSGKNIFIVSAMKDVTNLLERMLFLHEKGNEDWEKILSEFSNRHLLVGNHLNLSGIYPFAHDEIMKHLEEEINFSHKSLEEKYDSVVSFGEMASAVLLWSLFQKKRSSPMYLPAQEVIRTDDNFTQASVRHDLTEKLFSRASLRKKIRNHEIIISFGFVGATEEERITTLGKESSDYSAGLFAKYLEVDELVIFKDVGAIFDADPRKNKDARQLLFPTYDNILEVLRKGGHQVLHKNLIVFCKENNIPIIIKNFWTDKIGTVITHSSSTAQYIAERREKELFF